MVARRQIFFALLLLLPALTALLPLLPQENLRKRLGAELSRLSGSPCEVAAVYLKLLPWRVCGLRI